MKIKKSDLIEIHELLEEMEGFFSSSLDFVDDDQEDYIYNSLKKIRKALDKIENIIK